VTPHTVSSGHTSRSTALNSGGNEYSPVAGAVVNSKSDEWAYAGGTDVSAAAKDGGIAR
jgi:hypothetical protein